MLQPDGEGRYQWADGAVYEGSWQVRGAQGSWLHLGCQVQHQMSRMAPGTRCSLCKRLVETGGRAPPSAAGRTQMLSPALYTATHTTMGQRSHSAVGLQTQQGGHQHGVGRYTWPSGATYQGEWKAGCMHGVGTLQSPKLDLGARWVSREWVVKGLGVLGCRSGCLDLGVRWVSREWVLGEWALGEWVSREWGRGAHARPGAHPSRHRARALN